MKKSNSGLIILMSTLVAALAGFLFGYDTGVISGSQLYFSEYFEFDKLEKGAAVSSAILGSFAGALIAGFLSQAISRKYSLIFSGVLFVISAWGSGIPEHFTTLIIYRFIGGIGVGIASMTAPMYIAEIAPPKIRGRLVSYYQMAVVLGFFTVFLVTYFIGGNNNPDATASELQALHDYNVNRGWRLMLWSELIPAFLFVILLLFVPHSPRWLMMKNRNEQARGILRLITASDEEFKTEFIEMKNSVREQDQQQKNLIFSAKFRKILLIGILLSVFQQVTGINAILYYGPEIFSSALGYGAEDALKQQLLLGGVNFGATFIALFTVDKWGRKPLLIFGASGMLIGMALLSFVLMTGQIETLGLLALIGMLLFIASFALSLGPVVWVMLAEIFPNKVRSQGMSIAVAAQWLANWSVALVFPTIAGSALNNDSFDGALPYVIFGGFCIITIIFVLKMVPETKGKSLEELEEKLIQ